MVEFDVRIDSFRELEDGPRSTSAARCATVCAHKWSPA